MPRVVQLLDSINSGVIAGNRMADNVDDHFEHHTHLMFPSRSIQTDGIQAGIMSSFSFTQVSGTLLMLHLHYLFRSIDPVKHEAYKQHAVHMKLSNKVMSEMMIKNNLVQIKEVPPYLLNLKEKVLLNPMAHVQPDAKSGSYTCIANPLLAKKSASVLELTKIYHNPVSTLNVHSTIPSELITAVPSHNPNFVSHNFTDAEIAYCSAQPSPASSFTTQ
ncbi:hypothetical protein GYMLUDRAFT_998761 [Collybiopsis luxurians FD-317 M1]|uniref:Uncharacterized protein n=1 Tax=Collybiopsis luxurians FD-317 M1 TaxID=944289 RepID=A0A0D0CP62_9AGAR|nr:hypothetical protein GYMLUDRAFT_998761 [Collybiopsis luxurians FD-317 M1]